MDNAFSHASSLRSVQRLLWDAVNERLKDAERDEVKRAVGNLLVEENEALFAEATALADILGDVQLNTGALLSRKQICSNPERSMVEANILLVMDRLRAMVTTAMFANSTAKDRNPDSIVPKADAQDKAIYEYMQASTALQASSERPSTPLMRPSTASSRPPTASTLSRPSTASSTASTSTAMDPSQVMACVQGKLSVFGIDDVKDALRCALSEERAALLNDIDYLTALLTDEADLQLKASAPPPSLHELKQYSTKLKTLVEAEQGRLEHELVVSRMFNAAQAEASKAGRLRRMVGASREVQPAAATQLGAQVLHPLPAATQRGLDSLPPRPSHNTASHSPARSHASSLNSTSHSFVQQNQQGEASILLLPAHHVSGAPVPFSSAAASTLQGAAFTLQGDSLGRTQPIATSGVSSPDSAQALALSSSLSGSITGEGTSSAHQTPGVLKPTTGRVQSAPHQGLPAAASASTSSPPVGRTAANGAPVVQRSSSGRRQVIQALRATSASSAHDTSRPAEVSDAPHSIVRSSSALQGADEAAALSPLRQPSPVQQQPSPVQQQLKPRSMVPKLAASDLLDAHAETLKGGVAAILAKHNYQTRI